MTTSAAMPPAEPVTASVRIAAPPDVVFPYFTDPALATKWIAEVADLDARPGGVFAIDVRGNPARGHFVEVDPPHRVVFTWGVNGQAALPPGSSTVEVVLVAEGDDTVVTLTHRDLPEDYRASHQRGMDAVPGRAGPGGRVGLRTGRRGGVGPEPARRPRPGAPETRTCYIFGTSAALTWQGPRTAREAAPRCSSKRAPNSSSCAPSCVATTPSC